MSYFPQNFADQSIEMVTNGLFMLIFMLAMGIYVSTLHYLERHAMQYKRKWLYTEKEISFITGKHMSVLVVRFSWKKGWK